MVRNKVFQVLIHRQITCSTLIQTCRWIGELAMLLLVIWPITLKHYMLHVMLLIFWHHTQLLMSIIRLRTFIVMAE